MMIAHSFADPFFGPAQRLHGATYSVELTVRTPSLNSHHVVMDIGALRDLLRATIASLDYSNLDENPAFPGRTSTTERVAEYLAKTLAVRIAQLSPDAAPPAPASLCVVLRESPVAWGSCELEIPTGGVA
jgi:6-pyruvoyltetrahydropterin/6-carboxytetrahydropterin synthase